MKICYTLCAGFKLWTTCSRNQKAETLRIFDARVYLFACDIEHFSSIETLEHTLFKNLNLTINISLFDSSMMLYWQYFRVGNLFMTLTLPEAEPV